MPDRKLVLASSSSFRKMLLERLLLPFETANPDIDETPISGEQPIELVQRLAVEKARTVGLVFSNALVIGSDQVAVHDGEIFGKPITHENALLQLRKASGKKIQLYTGLAVVNTITKKVQSQVVPFSVHFKTLSEHVIEAYLHREKPYNCAGSVRAEGLGIALLERFEGDDPTALIGLPLIALVAMLEKENYPIFP